MSTLQALSDQSDTWSAIDAGQTDLLVAATTQNSCASIALLGRDLAGFIDRALQALWKTQLQMRAGARAWTEVLSLGQSHGRAAGNGLRAASRTRARRAVSRQLSSGACTPRGDLCDQPRTLASARGVLVRPNERFHPAHCPLRYSPRGRPPRQYDRGLAHPSTVWVIGGQS